LEQDLQQLLRSVLREELAPVNHWLNNIETDIQEIKVDALGIQQGAR